MESILVTGGTGFLGSHLVKRLVGDDNNVTVVSTTIRDKTSLKALDLDLDKINLVKGDVRDFDFLRKLFNEYEFDYVYHLGAISEVRKCQGDAKLAYDVNVGGTINILECVRLYGNVKGIAISSSDKAYGDGDDYVGITASRAESTANVHRGPAGLGQRINQSIIPLTLQLLLDSARRNARSD